MRMLNCLFLLSLAGLFPVVSLAAPVVAAKPGSAAGYMYFPAGTTGSSAGSNTAVRLKVE